MFLVSPVTTLDIAWVAGEGEGAGVVAVAAEKMATVEATAVGVQQTTKKVEASHRAGAGLSH